MHLQLKNRLTPKSYIYIYMLIDRKEIEQRVLELEPARASVLTTKINSIRK